MTVFVLQFPLKKDTGNRSCTEREIDDSRSAINNNQTLRTKRVERSDAKPQESELHDFVDHRW